MSCCEMVVNTWINRYQTEGLNGLLTRPGRGRKSILETAQDEAKIKEVVQAKR
jgi:transposase